MDETDSLRQEIRSRIASSAGAMLQRVERDGMELTYAKDIDHLYVMIGEPAPSLSFPLEDAMDSILLYDPETYEIRGWEFPSFRQNYPRVKGTNASLDLFARLTAHSDNVYIPGGVEQEQAEQALSELALVV